MYIFLKLFNQKCFQFILMCFIATIHLIVTPFTKVEESFQLQATHDFLNIGFPKLYQCVYISLITGQLEFDTDKCWTKIERLDDRTGQSNLFNILPKPKQITYKRWDHEEFPGVVPRTFIPSFILSTMSLPFKLITRNNIFFQILVRLNLAILVILAMLYLSENVRNKFGNYTGSLFIIITCTQFHFIFYSSRTLPNTFALLLIILGYSFWLRKQFAYLIVISAFCVLIFRFETCIIFGTIFLIELFLKKNINPFYFLSIGILAGLAAILTTVLFDSIFWGKIIWPELESMYFNLYLNKSSEWGTSPFWWYFIVAIPKLMLSSLFFLSPTCKSTLKFYPIILMHVGLHSILPHKELRFIIYIVPLLNNCAAERIADLFKIIDPTLALNMNENKKTFIELNKVYDTKDFSSYRTFQKDELKELEKIRPQIRKENLLRKRKATSDTTKNALSTNSNPLVVAEYVFSYSKNGLICEGYDYLKGICNSKLKNKNNIDLNELLSLKEDIDQQKEMKKNIKSNNGDQIAGSWTINNENNNQSNDDKKTNSNEQPVFTIKFIILFMGIVLHFCLNFAVSTFALFISFYNYPGGDAVMWVNDNIPKHLNQFKLNTSDVAIHVGNLAAQTGFTRFAELESIAYDKSPNFLTMTTGNADETIRKRTYKYSQSLYLDLTKYKLVYLILDDIKPEMLNQYCRSIKQLSQSNKIPYGIDKLECNFNKLRKCRVNSVLYGYSSVHWKLDSKFLNIIKIPMIYIYRCLKE